MYLLKLLVLNPENKHFGTQQKNYKVLFHDSSKLILMMLKKIIDLWNNSSRCFYYCHWSWFDVSVLLMLNIFSPMRWEIYNEKINLSTFSFIIYDMKLSISKTVCKKVRKSFHNINSLPWKEHFILFKSEIK